MKNGKRQTVTASDLRRLMAEEWDGIERRSIKRVDVIPSHWESIAQIGKRLGIAQTSVHRYLGLASHDVARRTFLEQTPAGIRRFPRYCPRAVLRVVEPDAPELLGDGRPVPGSVFPAPCAT